MKILVIEDEHKVATILKRGLEQEAHSVELTYDATEGLKKATAGDFDLVILDRDVDGKAKGLQIAAKMRAAKIHTPVLLLTDEAAASKNLDPNIDDFQPKPFAFSDLLQRIRHVTGTTSEKVVYKDIVLDPVSFTVTRAKQNIELTGREFTLLEYLMRNPGRVLSKDMITAYVWDYATDILPNTIEVYIGYLRNKVEKPFGDETLMRTRRGFGYIFGESK